jgi:hypothetical protein
LVHLEAHPRELFVQRFRIAKIGQLIGQPSLSAACGLGILMEVAGVSHTSIVIWHPERLLPDHLGVPHLLRLVNISGDDILLLVRHIDSLLLPDPKFGSVAHTGLHEFLDSAAQRLPRRIRFDLLGRHQPAVHLSQLFMK